jgi:hypothetical protein
MDRRSVDLAMSCRQRALPHPYRKNMTPGLGCSKGTHRSHCSFKGRGSTRDLRNPLSI